jgi:hypothetical protein
VNHTHTHTQTQTLCLIEVCVSCGQQDIDEQESLELLRKWREEEKKRKENAKAAEESAAERKAATPVNGFASIRASFSSEDNYRGSTGSRQSFLAASRMFVLSLPALVRVPTLKRARALCRTERPGSGRPAWKPAHVRHASLVPPSVSSSSPPSVPIFIPSPASSPSALGAPSSRNAFVRCHSRYPCFSSPPDHTTHATLTSACLPVLYSPADVDANNSSSNDNGNASSSDASSEASS